ncbi:Protein SUPPRESSOR OF FRI 4 [Diplonema papillatum]|nr:Protein SUPPRESSOR OF FRI 4 [Diplonema papillatum]
MFTTGVRAHPRGEPWCYYCAKKFNNEGLLVQHQKEKHFKCDTCGKRLTSSAGLKSHSQKLHSVEISKVPAAIEGRDSLTVEIYGMVGIPAELLTAEEKAYYTPQDANAAVVHPVTPQPMHFMGGGGMPPMMPMMGGMMRPMMPPGMYPGFPPMGGMPMPMPGMMPPMGHPGSSPPPMAPPAYNMAPPAVATPPPVAHTTYSD